MNHVRDRNPATAHSLTVGTASEPNSTGPTIMPTSADMSRARVPTNLASVEAFIAPPGMVGRDDVCRMFGIASSTLKRWERAGLIPRGRRPGGHWKLYEKAEIERLAQQHGTLRPPYPDPLRPGCYRLPLTGFAIRRHEAIIDAESLPIVQGKNFYWNNNGRHAGYVSLARKGETVPLHRMILGISDPELKVVHLNGNPLDCRRENLTAKTLQEQVFGNAKRATHMGRPCSSQYKGVCWDKRREMWVVYITRDGRQRFVGRFNDEETAAEAYDNAARELFGEHAWLNFSGESRLSPVRGGRQRLRDRFSRGPWTCSAPRGADEKSLRRSHQPFSP